MNKHDMTKIKDFASSALKDILTAVALLTRLPVYVAIDFSKQAGAKSAWAWPLVGILVAGLGLLAGLTAFQLGVNSASSAIITVGVQILVTGALHEDGLADTADGFWGGFEKKRRLEIMKDSQIGTYGVLSLLMFFSLRAFSLSSIMLTPSAIQVILACAILSRLPMVLLMHFLPNARGAGLANSVGTPSRTAAIIASVLCIVLTLTLAPSLTLSLFITALIITFLIGLIAKRKIQGQTGDVLGASQQVCEAVLLTLTAASIG